jgi:hypothetical protein
MLYIWRQMYRQYPAINPEHAECRHPAKSGAAATAAARKMMSVGSIPGAVAPVRHQPTESSVPAASGSRTLAENARHVASVASARRPASQVAVLVMYEATDPWRAADVSRPTAYAGLDPEAAIRGRSARVLMDEEFVARASRTRSRAAPGTPRGVSEFCCTPDAAREGRSVPDAGGRTN